MGVSYICDMLSLLGCTVSMRATLYAAHSFIQNTNEIYETVMQVAGSDVMKEKAMEMKQAIDCQMTWESIVKRIEDLV